MGLVSAAMGAVMGGFSAPSSTPSNQRASSTTTTTTRLQVAVDPTVVSKRDYEDICGISFNQESLAQRLQRTNFLYPKHVEIIEDIAPIADAMVDDIVSAVLLLFVLFVFWVETEESFQAMI